MQAVITVLPALTALCSLLQSAADADAPAAAGLDGAALRHSLLELAGLLESCDMRATDMMAMLRQRAGAMPGMHALDEAVSALDFDGAAALCSDLLSETTP